MQKLSNIEKMILENITNITNKIEITYNNMYKLEINNKQNTKEYKKEIKILENLLLKELNYYNEELTSKETYINILKYLENPNIQNISPRLINKLIEKRKDYECNKEIEENYSKENINALKELGYKSQNEITKLIKNNISLNNNLSKILLEEQKTLSLYYLTTQTQNTNQKINNYIIKTKYDYIKNYSLERNFISNNFKIEKPDILSNSELSFFLGVPEEDIEQEKETILERQIEKLLLIILNTPDYYYDEIDIYLSITKLKSLLKASLELAENTTINQIYTETIKYLKSNNYKKTHPENIISKAIITNILKEENTNSKVKQKILKLKEN